MADLLLDISNLSADYTIYVSFMLGLIVKCLWVWNIEYLFINSLTNTDKCDSLSINPQQQLNGFLFCHPLLSWITKCIRKKEGPDDLDGITPIIH